MRMHTFFFFFYSARFGPTLNIRTGSLRSKKGKLRLCLHIFKAPLEPFSQIWFWLHSDVKKTEQTIKQKETKTKRQLSVVMKY